MKKRVSLLFIFFILIIIPSVTAITGESITGEISVQETNVSITVLLPVPILSIISPENETYLTKKNLLLNYSALSADFVWYNLDNNPPNKTINTSIYFNTTKGSHTLYLYANNSYGEVSENVNFTVDPDKFKIHYNKWKGANKGSSTDFNRSSYEDIQNLSNIILEHTTYGKIRFNQAINLTDDANISDNEIDLDTHVNISENKIELNSATLPNFNKLATLWLYNLAFDDPRILKDGSVCPPSICTEESYSNGTLKFNVTGFTIYSAEETPTPTPSPGGGGGAPVKKDFSINKETISITLKQGQTKKDSFIIRNTVNTKIDIILENPKLADFIKISETEFYLNVGESKVIVLDFLAREDTIPDLYVGKLIIKGDGIEKEILIAIEIESKKALFDVKVRIPRKFLYVLPGEELFAEIELYNLGEIGRVDVNLEYMIKNDQNEIILFEEETVAVETRTNFIKRFEIPENLKFGKYIFYMRVTYNGETAGASAWFSVGEIPFWNIEKITLAIVLIVIIIVVSIIIYEIRKIKKVLKPKISRKTLVERGLIKRKRR